MIHTVKGFWCLVDETRASLIAQSVKNLPAMQETWVRFLGREDPLEKEIAIHSSILAWKIPWTEELGGLHSTGSQRIGHNWSALAHSSPWGRPWIAIALLFKFHTSLGPYIFKPAGLCLSGLALVQRELWLPSIRTFSHLIPFLEFQPALEPTEVR